MNNNKLLGPILIIFVFLLAGNFYISFMKKNEAIKERELKSLMADQDQKKEELNNLSKEIARVDENYLSLSEEFKNRFGYDYNNSKEDEINTFISANKSSSKDLEDQIRTIVVNYGNYYKGEIYDNEELDVVLSRFTSLVEGSSGGDMTDPYKDLGIKKLMKSYDGSISYIMGRNRDRDQDSLNNLMFLYLIYSSKLKYFADDESVPVYEVYAAIVNLKNLLAKAENMGYDLGNLKAENLEYLRANIKDLMISYYKKKGLVKALG